MSYRGGRGRGGRGRGEYYKNKYGGGGRNGGGRNGGGRNGGGRGGRTDQDTRPHRRPQGGNSNDLSSLCNRLDGKSYSCYHDLDTEWHFADFILSVGRAQSDPFAAPTRCRITVPADRARFDPKLYSTKPRSMALADFLHRHLYQQCRSMGADEAFQGQGWKGPKGGDVSVDSPCQHVLERSATTVSSSGNVTAQVTINLPARGRTILGRAAEEILCRTLPQLVSLALKAASLEAKKVMLHVDSIDDQVWLQSQLESNGLVAFVRNGAILARASGADDRPIESKEAVPFQSPPSYKVSFTLPNSGVIVEGLGIKKGISLVCGGGFHGKSTLLQAIQFGVYPKVPGDGREFCVTDPTATKIRAEDGRQVTAVDISPFIDNLPFGKDTKCFSSLDASGSTSQASNIIEVIEVGAKCLIMDDDTCATNFMHRGMKMQLLVPSEKEPITPFISKVRALWEGRGISTILVMGGSGDYFDVADTILAMDSYNCLDVTAQAKAISQAHVSSSPNLPFGNLQTRHLNSQVFHPGGKVRTRSESTVSYGDVDIDLSSVEQLVTQSQTRSIPYVLETIHSKIPRGTELPKALSVIDDIMDVSLDGLCGEFTYNGALARPRSIEVAAAINRLRRDGTLSQ